MLVAVRLRADGECEVTSETSLPAALGLLLIAIARIDWLEGAAVEYDANLFSEGEIYCALEHNIEHNTERTTTIRSASSVPEIRGVLEIARTITGRKLFTPQRKIIPAGDVRGGM